MVETTPKTRIPLHVGKVAGECKEELLLLHQLWDLMQGSAQSLASLALRDV